MRTTIDIQDDLLEEIIQKTGARSKKNAVELALREYSMLMKRRKLAKLIGSYDKFDLSLSELESMRNERK